MEIIFAYQSIKSINHWYIKPQPLSAVHNIKHKIMSKS